MRSGEREMNKQRGVKVHSVWEAVSRLVWLQHRLHRGGCPVGKGL